MKQTNQPNPIPERLLKELQKDAIDTFRLSSAPSVSVKKTIENPYSQVFVITVKAGNHNKTLYVKIPHSEFQGFEILKERLLTEYEIMQKMSSTDSNHFDYNVATPFGCYPDYPAIATYEAANDTLRLHYRSHARLLTPPLLQDHLMQEVSNCGLWLRDFQKKTHKENAAFNTNELAIYCEVRIKRLLKTNNLDFSTNLADGIINSILRLGESISPNEHKVVGRHNDFASHNVLAKNGRVWIIDFSMFDYGSSAYDPCNFWFDLEILKHDLTYSNKYISKLQDKFLESYGMIAPDDPEFKLAQCRYTLNRLVSSTVEIKKSKLGSLYRKKLIQASLGWLDGFSKVPIISN